MSLPIGNEIDLSEQLNELNTRIEKEKLRGSGFIFNSYYCFFTFRFI